MKKQPNPRRVTIGVPATDVAYAAIRDHCRDAGIKSVARFMLTAALNAAGRGDLVETLAMPGRPKGSV